MKGIHIPIAQLLGEEKLPLNISRLRFAMAYGSSPAQALALVLSGALL